MKKLFKGCLIVFIGFFVLGGVITLFTSSDDSLNEINSSKSTEQDNIISPDTLYAQAKYLYNAKLFKKSYLKLNDLETKGLDSIFTDFEEFKSKTQKEILKRINELEKNTIKNRYFSKKHDEFNKITWYSPLTEKGYGNKVYCYLGVKDDKSINNPRFVLQYYGDSWIFWKKATFLVDGKNYDFIPDKTPKRDSSSSVWETTDQNLDSNLKFIMLKIIESKKAKYRLSGKYSFDRNITKKQKIGIDKVLTFFNEYKEMRDLTMFCVSNGIQL